MKVEEKLREINHVFKVCGITLNDIKEQHKTGILRMNSGLNLKSFEINSMTSTNRFLKNNNESHKKKRKCNIKQSSTMGSNKSMFEKETKILRKETPDKSLDLLSDNSELKEENVPSEIKDILIRIDKPLNGQCIKNESVKDEINSKLALFDQLFNVRG